MINANRINKCLQELIELFMLTCANEFNCRTAWKTDVKFAAQNINLYAKYTKVYKSQCNLYKNFSVNAFNYNNISSFVVANCNKQVLYRDKYTQRYQCCHITQILVPREKGDIKLNNFQNKFWNTDYN